MEIIYYCTSGVVNSEGYKHKPVAQKKKAGLAQEYSGKEAGSGGDCGKMENTDFV